MIFGYINDSPMVEHFMLEKLANSVVFRYKQKTTVTLLNSTFRVGIGADK